VGVNLGSTRFGAAARRGAALLVIAALGIGPMVMSDPAGAIETRLNPDADARVERSDPDDNFGSSSRLIVDGSPLIESYLRFTVPALEGIVTKATLRLRVENATSNGPEVRLATTSVWDERAITWNDRPPAADAVLADAAKLSKSSWATFDVTPAVAAAGPVTFLLVPDGTDSAVFTSRQGSSRYRPELLVVTEMPPTTTTTSTTATSTTTTSTTTTTTSTTTTTTTTSTTTTSTTTTQPPTTTTTTTAPPDPATIAETGEPWLGLARLVTRECEPVCVQSTYSLSVEDVDASDGGDRRGAFRYPPGTSHVLRLEWARSAGGGGCGVPPEAVMDVSLRQPGGFRIGSDSWAAPIAPTCSGVLERPFELDDEPFDGNADDPYYGVMEIYGKLDAAGPSTGADTRGDAPLEPGDDPVRYARGHLVSGGVMVGWHEDGDDPVKLAGNEAILGEPFGLVRSYASTWRTPSTRVRDWLAQGKFVLWSVKPPHDLAGNDDWTPVADGTEDAMIRQQVQILQSWAEAGNATVGYIFNHEPHDNADMLGEVDDCEMIGDSSYPCSGTPTEFIDSYERIRAIIDELGATRVKLAYTATLSSAAATAPGSSVLGSGDPMTQGELGESVVTYSDLIAHDSYNWFCYRSSCNWDFPDDTGGWGRGVRLAETQGKQLIMAETASHPGCADPLTPAGYDCERADSTPSPTRDDWMRRIGTWLESDARARRWIVGFAYYHTLHSNEWRFADQTGLAAAGQEGWRNVFVVDSPLNDDLGGHDYFAQYGFNNL
jgi:hypothetical protein